MCFYWFINWFINSFKFFFFFFFFFLVFLERPQSPVSELPAKRARSGGGDGGQLTAMTAFRKTLPPLACCAAWPGGGGSLDLSSSVGIQLGFSNLTASISFLLYIFFFYLNENKKKNVFRHKAGTKHSLSSSGAQAFFLVLFPLSADLRFCYICII